MSFLNPVNEPVLRFKSTDAGAPQINYAARTAGDVKAVLKACLVTGYGSVASAGWSIVNEVDHVAEFVSPSAAMSDYRFGIDDKAATNTVWYYQYQDARTDPTGSTINKAIPMHSKTSPDNGWNVLVTARGVMFIELLGITGGVISRVTYLGLNKLPSNNTGVNISFFRSGPDTYYPMTDWTTPRYININNTTSGYRYFGNICTELANSVPGLASSAVTDGGVYVVSTNEGFAAQLPCVYLRAGGELPTNPSVTRVAGLDRDCLNLVIAGQATSANFTSIATLAIQMLIPIDYWGY